MPLQQIILKYYNPLLHIAMGSWQQVYLITNSQPQQLLPEHHKGRLVYRLPGSHKRIAYKRIKTGLQQKETIIAVHVLPDILPF